MPRKPKQTKQKITVVVNGNPISVTLHPPNHSRTSWFAYWNGAKYSRSTGCSRFDDAVAVAENMVLGKGNRCQLQGAILTDEEFIEIQRRHFGKKKGDAAQARAAKSLVSCLEAFTAFKEISGLEHVATATPDDCESFQHKALSLPKNWRAKHPKSQSDVECLSPNTVVKWSVALQAAFERSNRNAGKKCVRGVVPEEKLLSDNPWRMFTWIEGREKEIRQFNGAELVSFLDYLESEWSGVCLAPLMAKTYVWSASRREEVAGLRWSDHRLAANDEHHFEVVGKWGVVKWFRIPATLYHDLDANKKDSPYVFGALPEQLRDFHVRGVRPWMAKSIKPDFDVYNAGRWFYERVKTWSNSLQNGEACTHVFRKTTLQFARQGEDVNRQVASDAKVTEAVMMTSYVRERDEELRQKSNRTFQRIAASLSPEVAIRFGHVDSPSAVLMRQGRAAFDAENWEEVAKIASELNRLKNTDS